MFICGSKLGFGGFTFTGTDGIQTVKTVAQSNEAYNLAGQKVDGTYKGIVIKDQKKMQKKEAH